VRARTEVALRQSEERFRCVANATPSILWSASADGELTWLSDRWLEYTGLPVRVDRDSRNAAIHPADRHLAADAWARAHAGADFDVELRLRRRDGAYRWFLVRAKAMRGDDGAATVWYAATTDIHDHKQAEVALRDVDRRKDEFLATLAHELRNPLAPLRNAVSIRKLTGSDDPLQEMMERQLGLLVRLIDDLLDVARISRGKLTLKPEPTTLQDILHAAIETASPVLEAGAHPLQVALPELDLPMLADGERLSQVFSNLLSNAAKYSDTGRPIEIVANRDGRMVSVCVHDRGIGLTDQQTRDIFELFAQVDTSIERARGGLGIGLTLVKQLVEMHGGVIAVESPGLEQGSTFRVTLPLRDAPVLPSPAPVAPSRNTPVGARRILVLDDNRDAADTLAMMLELLGHDVRRLYDPQEAVAEVDRFNPDLVFLDIGMPNLSGYELARRLRAQPGGADRVLVAVTGWGQPDDRRRTAEAGFDHHLVKPPDLDIVRTICEDAVRLA